MNADYINEQLDRLTDLEFGYFSWWETECKEWTPSDTLFYALRNAIRDRHQANDRSAEAEKLLHQNMTDFRLIPVGDWVALMKAKTREWLNFHSPYSPKKFDEAEKLQLEEEVLSKIFAYLGAKGVRHAWHIDEKFDDYYTPFGDQMSFNIVLYTPGMLHVFHCGWSS